MSRATKHKLSVAGLVVSGLVLVMYLTTFRWSFGYYGGGCLVGFACWLFVLGFPISPPSQPGWLLESNHWEFYWLPLYENGVVGVPLWAVFLLVVIPSLIGWRRYRRPPPGHCQKCGYDLTGNVSGICPECGTEVAKP